MKAVSGITPLHVQAEGIAPAIGAAHVRVLCSAIFVPAHEYGVVMICILIEQPGSHKLDQHSPVNMAPPEQICKSSPHICVFRRQGKRLRLHIFLLRRRKLLSEIPAYQFPHRLRKGHVVVDAEKVNRMPTGLCLMVEPLVAADRDATI